jgi:hypothetical protein
MRRIDSCRNSKITNFMIIAFTLMMLASCGGGGGEGSSSFSRGSSVVNITVGGDGQTAGIKTQKTVLAAIPADVATISFTISASDIATIRKDVPVSGQASITETFTVDNGSSRYFLAEAKNAAGRVLYRGSAYADLNGGTVPLDIVMTAQFNISGTITSSGAALAGVTVTLAGAGSTSLTTNATGSYTFTNAANGSYNITPSLTGYSFSPTSIAVNVSGADITAQNFTAVPNVNAAEAAQYVSQALTYMTNKDVANAALVYEKALVADPANKDANFGGALTKIVMLIDDTKVRDILTKWQVALAPSVNQILTNASPVGNPFTKWSDAISNVSVPGVAVAKTTALATGSQDAFQAVAAAYIKLKDVLPKFTPQDSLAKSTAKTVAAVAPATAPSVSEMQTTISGTILPALNEALARLKKVEGAGYTFTMTKAMQGNPVSGVDIVLNDGEIYALETAINAVICMLNIAVSYDLDVYDADGNGTRNDYDKMKQDPLKTFNQSTFFTLKSTGAASMQAGLTAFKDGVTALDKAYAVVKTRTAANTAAGQGAFDLTNMAATDKTDFEKFLGYAKKAIVGQTDILYDNDTRTVAVDIAKFFTAPLDRTDLPTLGYDVPPNATLSAKYNDVVATEYTVGTAPYIYGPYPIHSEIVPTSDIPDYTLNGILPNNTASNGVTDFTGILPVVSGKLLSVQGGGDPLSLFYGAIMKSTGLPGTSDFYLSYNQTTGTIGTTPNPAVYKLDTTTGVISSYCTVSVTSIPVGYTYQGLLYYSKPEGIYAPIYKTTATGTDFEYRPITVAGQVCTIGSTAVKTFSIPTGKSYWGLEYVGSGVDMVSYYGETVASPYSFKLYRATDPASVLLTLTDSNKQFSGIRKGMITVRDIMHTQLLQYQVSGDGKSAALSGTFNNIDFIGYPPYPKVFTSGGGYYWLFDGYKMIKYAMKPDGSVP